ncbi:MAG: hypothetical protein JNL28_07165 [Planctomycetes bacterium]|nr:hypothetical protein [Planctomycetota bacterium]
MESKPSGEPRPGFEGRSRTDRRSVPTPRLSARSMRGGRRAIPRRVEEVENSFVDLYSSGLLFAILWVALMNSADSFFTIVHLQNGGEEANPIANVLLLTGRVSFVVLKSSIISLALLVLCVHKNFHLARLGLWTSAVAYTCLLVYHLALFFV